MVKPLKSVIRIKWLLPLVEARENNNVNYNKQSVYYEENKNNPVSSPICPTSYFISDPLSALVCTAGVVITAAA